MAHARRQAEVMAGTLREKFDLSSRWDGDVLRFERPGVSGTLTVAKAEVHLVARLGMLLAFMKPQIEGHINDELDRIFSAASPTPARKSASRAAKKTARPK